MLRLAATRPHVALSPLSLPWWLCPHVDAWWINLSPPAARTRITDPPQDQSVIKGTKASMSCGVTHDPSVDVRWVPGAGDGAGDARHRSVVLQCHLVPCAQGSRRWVPCAAWGGGCRVPGRPPGFPPGTGTSGRRTGPPWARRAAPGCGWTRRAPCTSPKPGRGTSAPTPARCSQLAATTRAAPTSVSGETPPSTPQAPRTPPYLCPHPNRCAPPPRPGSSPTPPRAPWPC